MAIIGPIGYRENANYWSTWSHVFQGFNTSWLGFDQRLLLGNFFSGLQGQIQMAFDTQIPAGSTILSAELQTTAFNTSAGALTVQINSPDRSLQQQKQDPMQAPFEIFRGYRKSQWDNAQTGALSTTFTAVYGTSVTTNGGWLMRQITAPGGTIPNRAHMAQRITTRTGNMTIASLYWELFRTGNPTGDLVVRIQGVTNDRGVDIPDGVDIAVSNPRACSSISTSATLEIFTFPVNPTLMPLTDYFILIEGTYPANNADYITVRVQNQFLTDGQLFHYGDGLGMDWQNYPDIVDVNQAWSDVANDITASVFWPIDGQTINAIETSPDISTILQAQIDMPNYTPDHGMILNVTRLSNTNLNAVQWSNAAPVVARRPLLTVTYAEPEPVEDVFPTGVRPGPDRRILAADDDTAITVAHAFMEMRKRWR